MELGRRGKHPPLDLLPQRDGHGGCPLPGRSGSFSGDGRLLYSKHNGSVPVMIPLGVVAMEIASNAVVYNTSAVWAGRASP